MSFSSYSDVIGCSQELAAVEVRVVVEPSPDSGLLVPIAPDGPLPAGLSWESLRGAGFSGKAGTTLVLPASLEGTGPVILAGLGAEDSTHSAGPASTADRWRDAAGLGSRADSPHAQLALRLPDDADPATVQAAVEGALLARYRYDALRAEPQGHRLTRLEVVGGGSLPAVQAAAKRGVAHAAATALTRDLATSPHNHLTATRFAQIAVVLGEAAGLEVEVHDQDRIVAEHLGALLAVNAGSSQEARVVTLRYRPSGDPTGRLALVGKGIMYDSGGIGLKPNNASHAQMKNDMTGAATILAAMLALPGLGGTAEVTGYLMCTDNMPSSTATALGDVCRGRSGRTIEIIDTDAEGRLVLSDGISLAAEAGADAIVDIATLTGSVARALGPLLTGLFASDEALADAVTSAATAAGEPVSRLPLAHAYRDQLDSPVADICNVGPDGAPDGILAALFLHEFTDGIPWAHLDIAGTAWTSADAGWRTPGCTGTGARTLLTLAASFGA